MGNLNGGVIESSKVFDFEILKGDDNRDSGGLVGELSGGRISSSSVEDSKIRAKDYGGGLVGESRGSSTIENSYTLNTTVQGSTDDSSAQNGGLVGISHGDLTITGSYVKNSTVHRGGYNGGILGNQSGTTLIINSFVKNVDVSASSYVGGIVGRGIVKIYSSYVDSTSSVSGATAGGLVGFSNVGGRIFHSYSHAPVQGSSTVGSLAGTIHQTEINRSYGAGLLSATSGTNPTIGGLVGSPQSSQINDSFWDTETTSQTSSAAEGNIEHTTGYTAPGAALGTNDIKTGCAEGATNGICALGNAFVYAEGSYPKIKECIENCSHSNISEHVHGEALLDGQDESLY